MTLVVRGGFYPIVGIKKEKKKERKIFIRREASEPARVNMLLRTVSYSVSWQFGSGMVDRRHEMRVKFRLGDVRKGTIR